MTISTQSLPSKLLDWSVRRQLPSLKPPWITGPIRFTSVSATTPMPAFSRSELRRQNGGSGVHMHMPRAGVFVALNTFRSPADGACNGRWIRRGMGVDAVIAADISVLDYLAPASEFAAALSVRVRPPITKPSALSRAFRHSSSGAARVLSLPQ